MNALANIVIDHLGGSTAVARMIEAPLSTVHSWRKNGIPHSRMAHLRLAARAAGTILPNNLADLMHAGGDAAAQHVPSTGQSPDLSGADQLRGVA